MWALVFTGLCTTIAHFLSNNLVVTAVTACVVYLALAFIGRKAKDPYGSFHLSLNAVHPGQNEGRPPTEWLNMGYWKDAQTLPQASEALALKVFKAAGCESGGHVLDVGHGSGESLILQLQCPVVPRPSRLTGITSLHEHYQRSLERVQALNSGTIVSLHHGDAVYRAKSGQPGTKHPLDPSVCFEEYTSIVAIDCAYHFRTRIKFLRQCFTCLAPGGRVALADLCFDGSSSVWCRKILAFLGAMPKENIVTKEEYIRSMEILGYEEVQLEDISKDVFPGFALFLSSRGLGWQLFAKIIRLMFAAGLRFVIVHGRR